MCNYSTHSYTKTYDIHRKRRKEVEEEMIRMREMSGGGVGVGVRDRAKGDQAIYIYIVSTSNVRTYCVNTSRKVVPHQRKELHFTDTVIQKPQVKERNGFKFLIALNLLLQLHHPLLSKLASNLRTAVTNRTLFGVGKYLYHGMWLIIDKNPSAN